MIMQESRFEFVPACDFNPSKTIFFHDSDDGITADDHSFKCPSATPLFPPLSVTLYFSVCAERLIVVTTNKSWQMQR